MNLNAGAQRVCVYAGLVMVALFVGGLLVSGFLIPPSPRAGADEVARFFAEHTTRGLAVEAGSAESAGDGPRGAEPSVALELALMRAELNKVTAALAAKS